jgi:hypothetical protein
MDNVKSVAARDLTYSNDIAFALFYTFFIAFVLICIHAKSEKSASLLQVNKFYYFFFIQNFQFNDV